MRDEQRGRLGRLGQLFLAAAGTLCCMPAQAEAPCRIAYDIGSSGVRAGASNSALVTRAGIDYLASLRAGRGLDDAIPPTIAALNETPRQAGFSRHCARVGGGFSAWRLAAQQDVGRLVAQLVQVNAATGVAVLVIPQNAEGAYGYSGARQLLGARLATSHVLDIGGGSLQISGAQTSYGQALGQKIWHQQLCLALRNTATQPCDLAPMSDGDLQKARALLAQRLEGAGAAFPHAVTMTAISLPVTQGVAPAVDRLLQHAPGQRRLSQRDLGEAIGQSAGLTLAETARRLAIAPHYAAYLLSDMLLVEGVMQATGGEDMQIAEVDLTNLPGLLADDRAYRWGDDYGCYLQRLAQSGVDAYASDPATCRADRAARRPDR